MQHANVAPSSSCLPSSSAPGTRTLPQLRHLLLCASLLHIYTYLQTILRIRRYYILQVVGDRPGAAAKAARPYVDDVIREIRTTSIGGAGRRDHGDHDGGGGGVQTLFFGGGTPSLCPPELVGLLIETVRECYGIAAGAEISIEMDPGTFDEVCPQNASNGVEKECGVGGRRQAVAGAVCPTSCDDFVKMAMMMCCCCRTQKLID